LSLIEINGEQDWCMFEHNKTLGISCAFKARAPFSQSSRLCYGTLHSLTVKKIIIWLIFALTW